MVNMVEILCTYGGQKKNGTRCNYSRNGGRGIKENNGRVNLSMINIS
jgi:hypothetical protein